MRICSL